MRQAGSKAGDTSAREDAGTPDIAGLNYRFKSFNKDILKYPELIMVVGETLASEFS